MRKLAGELVPVADIEAAWLSVAGAVRTRLLLIPTKVAPRIVVLKTPAKAQALLRKEINAALAAIAAPGRRRVCLYSDAPTLRCMHELIEHIE